MPLKYQLFYYRNVTEQDIQTSVKRLIQNYDMILFKKKRYKKKLFLYFI